MCHIIMYMLLKTSLCFTAFNNYFPFLLLVRCVKKRNVTTSSLLMVLWFSPIRIHLKFLLNKIGELDKKKQSQHENLIRSAVLFVSAVTS